MGDELYPATLPLSQLPESQQRKFYRILDKVADVVEENVARPTNEMQAQELKRREKARAYAGKQPDFSLYGKTVTKRNVSVGGTGVLGVNGVTQHGHDPSTTLLLDMRYALRTSLTLPLNLKVCNNPVFVYQTLTAELLTIVKANSAHMTFLRLCDQLKRYSFGTTRKLEEVAQKIVSASGLPINGAHFRYDGVLDVSVCLEESRTFFGVISFSLVEHQLARDRETLIASVVKQLSGGEKGVEGRG